MSPEQQEEARFQFDGFVFERILLETLERVPPAEGEKLESGRIEINFRPRGEIEIDHDRKLARVLLGFKITPDPKKQPYSIIVEVRGTFSLLGGTLDHLIQFARAGASSVLFPYVRQMVSTITRDGKWGPVLINPINVQTLLQWQDDTTPTASSEPSQPPSQLPSGEPGSEN